MTLNLDDLAVTTFAIEPGDDDPSPMGPITANCPATQYVTNCKYSSITCFKGCESGPGGGC